MPNRGKNDSIPMFADGLRGGLILTPTARQVRCAYPADGHSRWRADGCACPFVGDVQKGLARADDCERWCDDPAASGDSDRFGVNRQVKELRCSGRPWRPSQLHMMLQRAAHVRMDARGPWGALGKDSWHGSENNELVVSASRWNATTEAQLADWTASLVGLIAAFWYPVSRTGPCCNHETPHRCVPHCGERERQVRADFLRAHGLSDENGPPLLELRRDRWHEPFRVARSTPQPSGSSGGRVVRRAEAPVERRPAQHHSRVSKDGEARRSNSGQMRRGH